MTKTRKNIRIVFAAPREYVLTERRTVEGEFVDDYTVCDRVSHLVSDEMIAEDRRERERAFAVLT